MNITINPMQTTNIQNGFAVQSDGLIQGLAQDDPAIRYALVSGLIASDEVLPMWGGVGVYENIPAGGYSPLGSTIGRATAVSGGSKPFAGFCVFNQAHNMINTPSSPVPLAAAGMTGNYYRLGSGARIAVKADPSLVSLDGTPISSQVSWDFNNQLLQPYDASTPTFAISSAVWANTAGGRLTIVAGAAVPWGLGDTVTISGATNTGTGGLTAINTSFVIDTYTDTTHFTLRAVAAAGVFGTIGGSPVLNAGTGALAVKVLYVQPANCKVVNYDAILGNATFNDNGCAALILI